MWKTRYGGTARRRQGEALRSGARDARGSAALYDVGMVTDRPKQLDLKQDAGLTVTWADGSTSFFPIEYLRKMSPSAEMRELRESMAENPLTVLPDSAASDEPITATSAELVGHYAMRIRFSDGHDTGIYSWDYLRQIDPGGDSDKAGGA